MHLDGLADLALVHGLRLDGEYRRGADEHLHVAGASLRAVRVVGRTGVLAVVVLVDAGEEQRAVAHYNDVLDLVGLEQPLVLGPGDVL